MTDEKLVADAEWLRTLAVLRFGRERGDISDRLNGIADRLASRTPPQAEGNVKKWSLSFYGSPPGVTVWNGYLDRPDSRHEIAHLDFASREARTAAGGFLHALVSEHNAALTALPDRREVEGWQPIETAPKDGTRILLLEGEDVYAGEWDMEFPEDSYWRSYCGQPVVETPEPDHWRPLPEPPAQPQGDNK